MSNNDKINTRPRNIYPGAKKQSAFRGHKNTQTDNTSPDEAVQHPENSPDTEYQAGMPDRRHISPIEAARRKKERKIVAWAASILILFIAVAVAIIARACGAHENKNDFRVYMPEKKVVAYSDIIRNGVVYLNAGDLAEYCRLTVSGSYDAIKLTTEDGGYAVFTPGSSTASINGASVALPAPAILDNGKLWLPVDFISSYFVGVNIVVNRETNKITVEREKAPGSTSDKPIYVEVSFKAVKPVTNNPDAIREMIASYTFKTDLTAYFAYLNPTDSKYLLLVNKSKPLGESFVPDGLSGLDKNLTLYGADIQLEQYAKNALEAMMKEMRAAGYTDIYVSSGYRTYTYQKQLFNGYIEAEKKKNPSLTDAQAAEIVKKYSAQPGYSEHQTGLCVDLFGTTMKELDESFALLPVYSWLTENAHKFGFVLRYPEDKTDITGYDYEPWHYRFVGQYHAAAMKASGLCLEEYLTTLDKSN